MKLEALEKISVTNKKIPKTFIMSVLGVSILPQTTNFS